MNQQVDFVTQIHSVLAVRYGAGWAKMWQGLDMGFVRADWGRVLREYEGNPSAIAHALDNLPVGPRPPTAGEFMQLCSSAPRPVMRMLPRAGSKPTAQQAEVIRMVSARKPLTGSTARATAFAGWRRILDRIEAGEQVSPTIRQWALGLARSHGGEHV